MKWGGRARQEILEKPHAQPTPEAWRFEVGGELAVDFERPPVDRMPFLVCGLECFALLAGRPERRAIAVGMNLNVAIVQEAKAMPAARMIKRVAGKLELFRPRPNGCDRRAKIKIDHNRLLHLDGCSLNDERRTPVKRCRRRRLYFERTPAA